MTTRTCDRCKKVIQDYGYHIVETKLICNPMANALEDYNKKYDICDWCMNNFKLDFLNLSQCAKEI